MKTEQILTIITSRQALPWEKKREGQYITANVVSLGNFVRTGEFEGTEQTFLD
jgi:hypothetical protein